MWFRASGLEVRLDWVLQSSTLTVYFNAPWLLLACQQDAPNICQGLLPNTTPQPWSLYLSATINNREKKNPLVTLPLLSLQALAATRDFVVPDREVQSDLPLVLKYLEMSSVEILPIMQALVREILRAVAWAFDLHKAYTIHHW